MRIFERAIFEKCWTSAASALRFLAVSRWNIRNGSVGILGTSRGCVPLSEETKAVLFPWPTF